MLRFLFRKLAPWLLLAIAVPLTRMIVRHLARAAYRHAVAKPTARAVHQVERQADSAVTDISKRASRTVRR
jgi:hypothetical protein